MAVAAGDPGAFRRNTLPAQGVASRDRLAMRLAAMPVAGQEDTEECQRLRRLARLSENKVDES
ncbi:MAG: hypothetical protein SVX28_02525 [Pseudomonadota bacterium]|nr:hypothetical protein [Pseudomonadota bacterium]